METPIKKRRIQLGLSLNEVARRANVDRSNLSRTERGIAGISLDAASRLAAVLGVSELEVLYPERFMERESA